MNEELVNLLKRFDKISIERETLPTTGTPFHRWYCTITKELGVGSITVEYTNMGFETCIREACALIDRKIA